MLHHHFKTPQTGGSLRSYYLAKALVDKGITTVMITTHNGSTVKKEMVDGIEVHYLPIAYDNSFGFVKRIRSFLKFVGSIVREAGQFKDSDVCYAISTPLTIGLAAIWIKNRYKIPYIFEVGDLWPDAPVQLGIVKNPLLKMALFKLERSIYKRAKSIVALSDVMKAEIQKKISGKKIAVIPNMADVDFYEPEEKRSDLEAKFGVSGKFVVSYIGTVGLANGLDNFLACAERALETTTTKTIHFLICGEGAELARLKKMAEAKSLRNLSFIPFQDREGAREVMNVTDAAFVSFKNEPVLETGSPIKYFDGLASGKLMIVNVGGWMKEEIERTGCGIAIKEADEFIEKILPFISNPEKLTLAKNASRKLAEEVYSRERLGENFSRLFSSKL